MLIALFLLFAPESKLLQIPLLDIVSVLSIAGRHTYQLSIFCKNSATGGAVVTAYEMTDG